MIDSGQVKNQSDLAKKLGISRVRICQILNLLKLDSLLIQELEKFGDPLKYKIITKRRLRPYVNKPSKEQIELLNILKPFSPNKNLNKKLPDIYQRARICLFFSITTFLTLYYNFYRII